MKGINIAFIRGAIVAWALLSLYQDLKWKTAEGYAEYILSGGWISRETTIPLALAFLIAAIYRQARHAWELRTLQDDLEKIKKRIYKGRK